MKTIYQLPTREPPRPEPPWPNGQWPPPTIFVQKQSKNQKISEQNTMKKDRKKQDDRLLKRLSLRDRRQQERLRAQIMADQLFMGV